MAHRITVAMTVPDARAERFHRTINSLFPKAKISGVAVALSYTIDSRLSAGELKKVGARLANPVIEKSSIRSVLAPKKYAYAIEIGFLPGVTDNVGKTAKQTIEDSLGRMFQDQENVYSSTFIFLYGSPSADDATAIARELHNSLIQRASIYTPGETFPIVVPKVALHERASADTVDLNVDDAELTRIGKEGIVNSDGTRRGPLALSLSAMHTIRDHYKKLRRNPTDIELESLAQTWSEHCKHSIFADPLDEVREGIYKRYIKGATEKIRKQKGKKDFCVSVFKDNSGGIVFDDRYLVTHKVETHNSPSALDPFGGAITGIVGVNRDALGFGLGAKPIANVYGFCVGDPSDKTMYYRDQDKKQPLLSARRILEGVVKGINAGGNESGIPTPLGFVATDYRYRGKPLVFAGTVGLIPRKIDGRKMHEKAARAGDYIVVVGGRVGMDGVHGATFSSESLSSGSPATAVQIGDPITQKKLSDAIIREARGANLYTSITDNGAGGISCSIAEMAKECGGCVVDLDKVPLKYPGLSPWQIWISESQERMTLSVPKAKWKELKKLFERHDVEATVVGTFTSSGSCVVKYNKKTIMDMTMSFLHDGRPVEYQKSTNVVRVHDQPKKTMVSDRALLSVLSSPNVASTSFISEQYDHEVQTSSVTKPLQGRGRVNVDAAMIQPVHDSTKGVVLSHGYAPWYSEIDTYAMAAAAIDTAVRNSVVAGASLDHLAILDNFCWSSSNTPERLYELKRSAQACYDIAVKYGTPYVSGKDSMFNDFRGFSANGKSVHLAALPTLLVSAIGVVSDAANTTTVDFKRDGDVIYVLGETHDELGASEYYATRGAIGNTVPKVNSAKNIRTYKSLSKLIRSGYIVSAIGVGRGGIGIAIAKSAIAGHFGASVDLRKLPGTARNDESILFSESQGRVVVSVRPNEVAAFEKHLKNVAFARIGVVGGESFDLALPTSKISTSLSALVNAYRKPFKNW